MAECLADRSERNPGVAARGLDYQLVWSDLASPVAGFDDMEGHSILDASRHIEIFGLGEYCADLSIESVFHLQQRCISY